MPLDLDLIGATREVAAEERPEPGKAPLVKRLRDSHHAVARLLAHGLTEAQVSLQTGYSLSRLSTLKHDPSFVELLHFYRRDHEQVALDTMARFHQVAMDAAQVVQERLLDEGEEMPIGEAREIFKVFADRAGFAPVQHTVNKNLNLNIGERLDAARRRRDQT